MKYLKLDARHSECHGLARALVGSPVVDDDCNEIRRLSAIEFSKGDYSFGLFYPEGKFRGCIFWEQEITIPIDTIKLCPYVAMREGVSVLVQPWAMGHTGLINTIHSGESLEIVVGDYGAFGLGEITLDLENLPKGAEVVEL